MSTEAAGARILLVEDNENIRGAFSILLEENGYDVLEAGSGEQAIAMTESENPDLILMDLGLPDVGGLEVTRRLKANPHTRDVVVVAITGRTLETDMNACLEAGCAGYLVKPVDTRQLLSRIPEFLSGANPDPAA